MTTKTVAKDKLSLKVAEAMNKDVGRGIARIDPADMQALEAEIGDVVEIVGKRRPAPRLFPPSTTKKGPPLWRPPPTVPCIGKATQRNRYK